MNLNIILKSLALVTIFFHLACHEQPSRLDGGLSSTSNALTEGTSAVIPTEPMTDNELAKWEHLSTGTHFYPYIWLQALNSVTFKDANGEFTLPVLADSAEMERRYGLKKSKYMVIEENGVQKQYVLPYTGLTLAWTSQDPQHSDAYIGEDEIVRNVNDAKSIRMLGTNCSLCHQAELNIDSKTNQKVHILGAPSTVSLKDFYSDLVLSTVAMFVKPDLMTKFLERVKQQHPELSHIQPAEDAKRIHKEFKNNVADSTLLPVLHQLDISLKKINISLIGDISYLWTLMSAKVLKDRTQFSKIKPAMSPAYMSLVKLTHNLKDDDNLGEIDVTSTWFGERAIGEKPGIKQTPFYFGRSDAFGSFANNYIRGSDPVDVTAPVSFPWVWGVKYMAMKHYFGNMNSTLLRNVGQTLAVGGSFSIEKNMTTVNMHALSYLENLMYKILPPNWETTFKDQSHLTEYQIRKDLLPLGKSLYERNCQGCHETNTFVGPHKNLRDYKIFPVDEIGTDPNDAINVTKKVKGENFSVVANRVTARVRDIYFENNNLTDAEKREIDSTLLQGPSFVRDTYLGFSDQENYGLDFGNIRPGSGYKARHLSGVWATGPFLHNGVVPTLAELLEPAHNRPSAFVLTGSVVFDPIKIGIQTKRFNSCPKELSIYEKCVDTKIAGNSKNGHEYGTALTQSEKQALIEYLKVLPPEPEYSR